MSTFDFIEVWKIVIFANFTCIWPFWRKLSKIVIFWCLKKYYLDIKRLPHRYSEVSLGPGEQISKHISDFGPHAAKYGFISKKIDKMRTWGLWVFFRSKNRFSLKWPILSGKSIYGRKMTSGGFTTITPPSEDTPPLQNDQNEKSTLDTPFKREF